MKSSFLGIFGFGLFFLFLFPFQCFVSFCFCFLFVFWFCFCFLFGGKVRWPEGPPHLALNPPFFFLVLFAFCFEKEKPDSPPKKGHVCLFFCVSLCFAFVFYTPPFLSLSHSLLSLFFSSFLLCFFLLSFFVLSLCFFALFLCFSFMKRTTASLFHQSCLYFFGCLSCYVIQIPFSYLAFLILSCAFCSTSKLYVSKDKSYQTPILGEVGGLQQNFYLWPGFFKMWKGIVALPNFGWNYADVTNNKLGISAHFYT